MLILKARYQEAANSIEERKADRFRDVVDEYYSFINNYPDSPNRAEADNILKIAQRYVKDWQTFIFTKTINLQYFSWISRKATRRSTPLHATWLSSLRTPATSMKPCASSQSAQTRLQHRWKATSKRNSRNSRPTTTTLKKWAKTVNRSKYPATTSASPNRR